MNGQLLRPRYGRQIAGVCAAFSRAYGWDLTLVRLVLVGLILFGGGGVLAYVICWIVIPEEPAGLSQYPPAAYPASYPPPTSPQSGQYPPPSTHYPPPADPNYTPPPTVPPAA